MFSRYAETVDLSGASLTFKSLQNYGSDPMLSPKTEDRVLSGNVDVESRKLSLVNCIYKGKSLYQTKLASMYMRLTKELDCVNHLFPILKKANVVL